MTERIYIGIFGRCNAGKSTLLNLLTGGRTAIVSPEAGTTTDTVRKSGEILGLGPVVWLDTAGVDDRSALAEERMERTREASAQVDIALLVYREWGEPEEELMGMLEGVPTILIKNEELRIKNGAAHGPNDEHWQQPPHKLAPLKIDALAGDPAPIFNAIKNILPHEPAQTLFGDKIHRGDTVLLVAPIDGEAPAGRLILPQVQALRELMDNHAVAVMAQPEEVAEMLKKITPKLIVADSQVLAEVKKMAGDIATTSFSILLAAAKGDRELYERGLKKVAELKDGDRVLITESCTHQSSCEDIGRVKIPRWLAEYTGKKLDFTVISGLTPLPENLSEYALAVQCGGCMVTRRQLLNRIRRIAAAGVPITNYGMLIQKIRG